MGDLNFSFSKVVWYTDRGSIETVLNNTHLTKKYQLKSSGYYGDEGNKDEDYISTWNKGMEQRCMIFRNGKKVELMGFILSDIMGIEASIVNGIEISIMLIPNMDIICLQTFRNKKYGQPIIDDLYMYICRRQFTKEVILAHNEIMEKQDTIYPYKRINVRAYNGNKGVTEVTIENPCESKIPTRFIVGMIGADSYIGNWGKSPLNFQHYDISRAAFYINDESIAKPPYKLDPSNGNFVEPFMELYSILGKAGEDMDIGISSDNYINSLFLLPFDVMPTSAANMKYLSKKQGGNCHIELQFCKPLPHNIIIITYPTFPMELKIDAARNCRVVPV